MGEKRFACGDKHIGEYVDDKRQGHGTYIWVSGDKYEGQWRDGKMCGRGVKTMKNKDVYEGEVGIAVPSCTCNAMSCLPFRIVHSYTRKCDAHCHNVFHRTPQWLDDRAHGRGVKRFAGGDQHEGEYAFDRRHGYGTYTWTNGDRFEGCWLRGEQRGKGTYYYHNNNVYKGEWAMGKKHGRGIFTAGNVSCAEVWHEGKRQTRRQIRHVPPRQLRTLRAEARASLGNEFIDDQPSVAATNDPDELRYEIDRLRSRLACIETATRRDSGTAKCDDATMCDGATGGGVTDLSVNVPAAGDAAAAGFAHPQSAPPTMSSRVPRRVVNSFPNVSENTCKVCFEATINTVLIRCGHMGVCLDCSRQLDKCPICRAEIDEVVQVFKC